MKKISLFLGVAVITTMMVTSCGGDAFKNITIASQEWMTENLNVDKFRNGDAIPEAKTDEEWIKAIENKQPAWCYYDNDPANGEKYGKLYNGYAVSDSRGLAPVGWHVPSDAEWTVLIKTLGGEAVAGMKLKSTSGWIDSGNGTNESGFSGLPSGLRYERGPFSEIGKIGYWWSSAKKVSSPARTRFLRYSSGYVYKHGSDKRRGLSVRCLRD
jgi:uncharacterized protein (TIGR02145 family)